MSIESDVNAFLKELETAIVKVLQTDVAETAKNALRDSIYERVYDVYDPLVYERKMDSGGLSDFENMDATVDATTLTLEVEDVREDEETGEDVAGKVERGWTNKRFSMPRRPFHKPAEERLVNTGDADGALERSLRNLGY